MYVEFRQFERELLRLAFTTSIELSPSSLAFFANCSVAEAERHMQAMVDQGVLELESDDEGRLRYRMPDRPAEPMHVEDPALWGYPPSLPPARALMTQGGLPTVWEPEPVRPGQAVAALFLNAMVCPGVGSMVGGKTGTGMAQLMLFLVGLPLAVITVGLPLMLAAWVWGIATGAQLVAESRE